MLNIGSLISNLFSKKKEVVTFVYLSNARKKIDAFILLSKSNPSIRFSIVINLEGTSEIDNLEQIIQKKPSNLYLYFYSSNRKIELHLLLMQLLTKNPDVNYFLVGKEFNPRTNGLTKKSYANIGGFEIDTEKLINTYLKNNQMNSLRALTFER